MSATTRPSILRLKDLQERIKLSRSCIYAKVAAGEFPPPMTLGPRAVGWLESDVVSWIESCASSSRKEDGAAFKSMIPKQPHLPNTHEPVLPRSNFDDEEVEYETTSQ